MISPSQQTSPDSPDSLDRVGRMHADLLRRARMRIVLLSATACISALAGCDRPAPAQADLRPAPRIEGIAVRVELPRSETLTRQVQAIGTLAARHEDQVATELGGAPVAHVLVEPGQTVRKGQLMARLGSELLLGELATRQARREEALAGKEHARLVLERSNALRGSRAVAEEEVERHRTDFLTTSARLAAADAELRDTQLRLARTELTAPEDGVVLTSQAAIGHVPQAGTTLFTLMRHGRVDWRAEVPSARLRELQPGHKAQLTLADGTVASGEVWRLEPIVQTSSRTGIVHVQLASQPGLRPGQFARGVIQAGSAKSLTVPMNAVLNRGDEQAVFVADAAGTSVRRKVVSTGQVLGDRVEVKSGLEPTDRVVTVGAGYLAEGARVTVVSAPASAGSRSDER